MAAADQDAREGRIVTGGLALAIGVWGIVGDPEPVPAGFVWFVVLVAVAVLSDLAVGIAAARRRPPNTRCR